MEWYFVLALIGVGLVAGFINTVAGGGSMLSMPLLIFLGLPANVANGTNRIAILLQNIVGLKTFKTKGIVPTTNDYKLTLPAIIGSIIGASIAVELDEVLMKKIIGIVMVIMLILVVIKPDIWVKERMKNAIGKPSYLQYFVFFLIGIYGGFIQLGVGFFLLGGLVLGCGYDLVRANAIKLLIVLFYTIFALLIFFYNKQVDLMSGLLLACGNMAGAYIGANFTVKGGAKYVRYVLIGALIIISVKLLTGI